MRVPLALPAPLRFAMLRLRLPRADRLEVAPVRDRDAEAVVAAHALDAEEARLLAAELLHPRRGLGVALVAGLTRREDDGVVRRPLRRRAHAAIVSRRTPPRLRPGS